MALLRLCVDGVNLVQRCNSFGLRGQAKRDPAFRFTEGYRPCIAFRACESAVAAALCRRSPRSLLQQRHLFVPAGSNRVHALRPQGLRELPREAVDGEHFLRLHQLHQFQQPIVVRVIA